MVFRWDTRFTTWGRAHGAAVAVLVAAVSPAGLAQAMQAVPAPADVAASAEVERIAAFERSLRPPVSVAGQPEVRWTLQERMAHWKVPGVSVAVIRDGALAWAKGYGVLQAGGQEAVDTDTVFSVASLSKVGNAVLVMRMVQQGLLELDGDVNRHITGWQLPASDWTVRRPVTLRGLLSHTAGLNVGAFADFQPGESLPSTLQVLQGQGPAKNQAVALQQEPGTRYRYSGGGTMVMQLIVESVTGQRYADAAQHLLLGPLGMGRSTYLNPLPPEHGNIAKAHDWKGQPRALPRGYEAMPEAAASGLWSTPSDIARMVLALIQGYRAGQGEGQFLDGRLARQMLSNVDNSHAGLGVFVAGDGMHLRFSHGGANDSYRSLLEGHPNRRSGVVILTNGTAGDGLIAEIRRAVAEVEGWPPELQSHRVLPAVSLSREELAEWVGDYEEREMVSLDRLDMADRDPGIWRITQDEPGYLLLQRGQGQSRKLLASTASHFVTEDGRVQIEAVRDYFGKPHGIVVSHPASSRIWTRAVRAGGHTTPATLSAGVSR